MIIGHNQPYLGMGIKHTRGNKVKGSNLTRIRGGEKIFDGFLGRKKIFFSPNLILKLEMNSLTQK